ncbi:MAG: polysaccharide biosynthesis tyrosine autokinase, partial [Mucilaginibacter sp.]
NNIVFIDKRLDSISKELNKSESQVEGYSIKEGLTDITTQSSSYVEHQQATKKEINDIDIQISIITGVENYLNSSKGTERPPSTGGLTDQSLNTMLEKLSDLQLKKDQYLATTPEKNPIFNPINKQIATLQESIRERVRTIKASLLATRKQLSSFNSGFESSIKKVPTQEKVYTGMKRTQDIKEKLFSYLLEKREEISLRYASSVSDAQVVDDAHVGPMQWPKPMIIYVMAFIIGLGIPAGIIYARDSFDVQITNRKQIEDEVTTPILGELSFQESSTPIVISQGRGKFAIGEQFRVLRTNLYHVHNSNESGRVTLFTSSTGGEGKSFVSANLAVTLAYASRKTIILEMDLRKPKISLTFDLPLDHLGISNYLDGEPLDLIQLIQPSGIPGLDVLGCGSLLPNPSELLERSKLDQLISSLREIYDDVIIDTPPIHLVTDALIIARVADASMYIMRQGYTQKAELDFIKEINLEKRLPKLNIIFNGIKRDKYGYGYNYDNSYYNTYVDRKKNTFGNMVKKFFSRF